MYQIKMQNEDSCEILLYSLIERGYTAQNIIDKLRMHPNLKTISIRINSDGGEVFEALTVYNYLKSLNLEITVYIDGIAASAASLIACVGKVIMPDNAMMMIHNPWGFAQGDSDDMRALAATLDKLKESSINIYVAKTGKSREKISSLMDAETWLTAQEAKELGLCDEVIKSAPPEDEPDTTEDIEEAVKAERERLRELDALMTPERKGIIEKAKYHTFQSAKDIAIELLKLQGRKDDSSELNDITPLPLRMEDDNIRSVAEIINARRGYNNGR